MTPSASILPLQLRKLTFKAGGKVLMKGISVDLNHGPLSVVIGPNGAGKSLLLRMCHGLIKPTSGDVLWAAPTGEAQRRQAMVFQRPILLRRSVRANVDYALSVRGTRRRERRDKVAEVLERTGLRRFAERQARSLSVGEQQKLALARVWVLSPQVLFLDEPTASLDPGATHAVEEIILAIHEAGTKVIMTTHDLSQARRMADEILFLHRGRLFEHGPADAFFTVPQTLEAAAFLAGKTLWRSKEAAA
ncbi:MAG: ATP-binding cassette domain-containing protein [Hyphomicrobiales bacterium]|nr:ATP-binding cassette domain-containing protein [Hyphomicrobiales bacterium]